MELVWKSPVHPGVAVPYIRVWRVATSGCRKPEDGHVSKHLSYNKIKKRITRHGLSSILYYQTFFRLLESADFFQRFVCFANGCCTLGEEFFFFGCQFQFNDLFDTVLT